MNSIRARLVLLARAYLLGVLVLLGAINGYRLIGWSPQLVLSGSMEPVISAGDIVVTAPAPIEKIDIGDIVLVQDLVNPRTTYLHRVTRRTTDGLIVTQGDANHEEDWPPITPNRVEGRLERIIPGVAYPLVAAYQGDYPLALTLSTTTLVALLAATRRPGDSPHRDAERPPGKD